VFDAGRVEQVGPAREVYERPATPFVAGFVGTSNLLRPDVAHTLLGRDGTWSVRPEKIGLTGPADDPPPDTTTATGTVSEIVYTGATTRCLVALDGAGSSGGARLTVLMVNDGHGRRPPEGTNAWTGKYWNWLSTVRFEHTAQEATLLDYRTEVERAADRIERLEKAIDEAVQDAPAQMKAVIDSLQALRGVAKVTATTLVTEVGNFSRFDKPTQLMGYGGTKTGNAHLRRVLVEAAWQYRNRPKLCGAHKKRQLGISDEIKRISWKAQQRLYNRYWRLTGRGKIPGKAITAVARELLGFIWAVGVQAEREAATA